RLIHPERVVFYLFSRLRPSIKPSGLLRIDHGHPRDRLFVPEVALPPVMPPIEILNHSQPAPIVEAPRHLVEPRPCSIGDPVEDPYARLGAVLHRIGPAMGRDDPHMKDPPDGLSPECGTILLAVLTIGPGRHDPAPPLAVGEQRRRQLADRLHVQPAQSA